MRNAKLLLLAAVATVASFSLVGCGGDDTVGPVADAGKDVSMPPMDGGIDTGTHDASDGGPKADAGDAGDGGACDFNTFVLGLIQNHTNNTDKPSSDLGQNCVDTQTPFPQSTFQ